jgi:hypothetical protein
MPGRPRRRTLTIAFIVALVGAGTLMLSPIMPWPTAVALPGLVLVVPAVIVLIWWLMRTW